MIIDKVRRTVESWSIKYSLWPVHIVTACCGVEYAHAFGSGYDAERFGLLPMPSVRQCNLLVVEGAITRKMAKFIKWVYDQMPEPKYVVALGSCTLKGGVFWDSYNVVPVDNVLPVDVYVPGCPPTPEAILRGIELLQRKIENRVVEKREVLSKEINIQHFFLEKEEVISESRRILTLIIGPQHPGSGHMRLFIHLDGDVIINVIPDPGFAHRGIEKVVESREFISCIPIVERASIMDSAHMSLGYVMCIEKLLNLEVPERAKYLRSIVCELSRIGTHLYDIAILAIFLGHSTGYMWGFGLRDLLNEFFTRITGARTTLTYIIPGGVRRDVKRKETLTELLNFLNYLERKIERFEDIFLKNPAVMVRLRNVGTLEKKKAIELGLVGPNARASGINYDTRRDLPYDAYPYVDFEVPILSDGDSYARTLIRFLEIKQSINIIRQLVKNIPEGNIIDEELKYLVPEEWKKQWITDVKGLMSVYLMIKLPRGETISRVEATRGLLLYHLISNGDSRPYRLRMITPSLLNLRGMVEAMIGNRLADVPAIYMSFGYFPPEFDR